MSDILLSLIIVCAAIGLVYTFYRRDRRNLDELFRRVNEMHNQEDDTDDRIR